MKQGTARLIQSRFLAFYSNSRGNNYYTPRKCVHLPCTSKDIMFSTETPSRPRLKFRRFSTAEQPIKPNLDNEKEDKKEESNVKAANSKYLTLKKDLTSTADKGLARPSAIVPTEIKSVAKGIMINKFDKVRL